MREGLHVTRIAIGAITVFLIAVLMTMTGRGGGNFYVPALVAAGQPIHQAATTGQFILMSTATAGMLIFQKHRMVDWKLALLIACAGAWAGCWEENSL